MRLAGFVARFLLLCAAAGLFSTVAAKTPRLVILLIAEQFRSEDLFRYRPDFGEGGFERLLQDGAVYRRARYRYVTTFSAPGVSTVATGAYPDEHGIVGNSWYDVEARRVREAAGPAGKESAGALVGSTIADELKLSTGGQSHVVALADRAPSAVFLAGSRPDGAYWRGPEGRFRTSSSYHRSLPEWVVAFNAEHPPTADGRSAWTAIDAAPDAPPLRQLEGSSFLQLLRASPYAVEDLFSLAKAAVENEQLGVQEFPDMLLVSFQAPALLALETGAESPLLRDMILRFDRQLADFLDWIDQHVGLQQTAIVFTAAHGIPPQRSDLRRIGLDGGVVDGGLLAERINNEIQLKFGPQVYVEKYIYPFLYLSPAVHEMEAEQRRRVLRAVGEAALEIPHVVAFDGAEVTSLPSWARDAFQRSRFRRRSGDLTLSYEPYWVELFGDGRGVTSGSPYRYDTDVPLIFYGPNFRPGLYETEADPRSIAPTLASILGISVPAAASGVPLGEILVEDSMMVGDAIR